MTSLLSERDHVVVVGAGFAGWRFVEALRREGFAGSITLVGDEPYAPYDRPPISKQVLVGKWDIDKTSMATPELLRQYDVDLRIGVAAVGLDVAATTVHLANGESIGASHVVIATGTRARQLPFSAGSSLHTLRSRDDVVRLRRHLSIIPQGGVVGIIGGGFIGAEAATALKTLGYRPVVFEGLARPLLNVLGPEVSEWLFELAADAGIELRTEQSIADVSHDDGLFTVHLNDGSRFACAAVLVAAGAQVNVEWLATSGLVIDNGVVVGADLLATDRIGAIGDVARFTWPNTAGEELVRIEHWQIANDHATALARRLVKRDNPEEYLIPYFWSDQYGKKIQMLGHPKPTDDARMVSGAVSDRKWVAIYSRNSVVTGIVALAHPRALMLSKALLETTTTLEAALSAAPWMN